MTIDPLIVDVYRDDGDKNWQALSAAGTPWHGAILKVSQGTHYNAASWFNANWRDVRAAGGARYGTDWFRGAYHYIDVGVDGRAQADYFLSLIDQAGGWDKGDLPPMVDVEEADQPKGATAAQVVACVTAFTAEIRSRLGRDTILYGGSYLADLGITSRMGARWLAIARYTPTLPQGALTQIGWDLASLALWQYCGDGTAALSGYPHEAPGCGKVDISALVLPGGITAVREQMLKH